MSQDNPPLALVPPLGNDPKWLQRAIHRWGEPISPYAARLRWSELCLAAESGEVCLIAPEGQRTMAVALVPFQDRAVDKPLALLPTWSVGEARGKLPVLVAAVHGTPGPALPQVLTRYSRPVLALVAVCVATERADEGTRVDPEAVVRAGGQIAIGLVSGTPAFVRGEDDYDPPEPDEVHAVATDERGVEIGRGIGGTVAEALLDLHSPRTGQDVPGHLYDEGPF